MKQDIIDILYSWTETEHAVNSMESLLEWINERNRNVVVNIKETSFVEGDFWYFNPETGYIENTAGKFFSIGGLRFRQRGKLITGRVLTAPAGFTPSYELIHGSESEIYDLPADDTFLKSLQYFSRCISDPQIREESYRNIQKQADLVDEFRRLSEQ